MNILAKRSFKVNVYNIFDVTELALSTISKVRSKGMLMDTFLDKSISEISIPNGIDESIKLKINSGDTVSFIYVDDDVRGSILVIVISNFEIASGVGLDASGSYDLTDFTPFDESESFRMEIFKLTGIKKLVRL